MPRPWITRDCIIVVMGVSGAGKSEISGRLARALRCGRIEGDTLHSAENKERIRRGIPLTDALRWPWLTAICDAAEATKERPLVIACSALKHRYRDFIRARLGPVRFLFLDGPAALIATRLRARTGHFATVALLDSQLAELEPPTAEENALKVDIALSPDEIVEQARQARVPG